MHQSEISTTGSWKKKLKIQEVFFFLCQYQTPNTWMLQEMYKNTGVFFSVFDGRVSHSDWVTFLMFSLQTRPFDGVSWQKL